MGMAGLGKVAHFTSPPSFQWFDNEEFQKRRHLGHDATEMDTDVNTAKGREIRTWMATERHT